MADGGGDAELEYRDEAFLDHDTFFAMESLQATLQHLEALLRQSEVSEDSSNEYCDNFCQALMHYAGSRNSIEHGLTLLEVYCLSINCFASARPHLTSSSSSVALVLKRLALSCFELLLSVPQNEIPLEAWLQFHGSVQAAHDAMMEYGSTDLQALVQITGEGGPWNNPTLVALLTEQPTEADELNAYLGFEGEDFLEMRIKQLEKVGEVMKALILTKACGNCHSLPGQATFLQTYVTQLCQQLPSEKAILEIARLDGKDVLDIICNMESEGDESTAFILCTTYFTQQLQQGSLYCSWELTLIWSKLQRRLEGSLESFLERCLQFGAIAKTVYHLLFLIRVIQTETMHLGVPVAVELCVKALQLPKQEGEETRTGICRTAACLLLDDLEVLRACQLTEFLLSPSREVFVGLEDLYKRPDQKYDGEKAVISISLRCELLFALKAHWPFDPEFWDWKTLKHHCVRLLGQKPEQGESLLFEEVASVPAVGNAPGVNDDENCGADACRLTEEKPDRAEEHTGAVEHEEASEGSQMWPQYKFLCKICQVEVVEEQFCHHAGKHMEKDVWTCPVCLQKFASKQDILLHSEKHLQSPPAKIRHLKKKKVKKKLQTEQKRDSEAEDLSDFSPGETPTRLYSPVLLPKAAAVPDKQADDDYITFDYIYTHYKLQDREVFPCPATDCSRYFKLFKYLCVHMKTEHPPEDPNVKHYTEINNRREKCTFCRRTFVTNHHLLQHRPVHYGDCPFMCLVAGCAAHFDSIHDLIAHKHSHGFRLAYHCALSGCSLSFCDLGQLYHHEAQHFRDAAYACTGPGCKKFYYSRQEFLEHLATHGISFTEKEFEEQRKRKRKLLLAGTEEPPGCNVNHESKLEYLNGAQMNPSQSCLQSKEARNSQTCVAVCFDGKTYTCGLEKCGRTFSRAREIQKHLKIVHPDQFLKDNTGCKETVPDQHLKIKSVHVHEAQDKSPTLGCSLPSTPLSLSPVSDLALSDTAPFSKLGTQACQSDLSGLLTEIISGLGQLSLSPTVPRNLQRKSWRRASKLPRVTSSSTGDATPPSKPSPSKVTPSKIKLRPHPAASDVKKMESPSKAEPLCEGGQPKSSLTQDTPKPFACEVNGCSYMSVTSLALKVHYVNKHGYSQKKVQNMDVFDPQFKPFRCHLCCKGYKERKQLRKHFLVHDISDGTANEILSSSTCIDRKALKVSATPKTTELPVEKKDLPIRNGIPLNGNHRLKHQTDVSNGVMKDKPSSQQGTSKGQASVDGGTVQKRTSKHPTSNTEQSSDEVREDKPCTCIHKDCDATFAKRDRLHHHLVSVHHYKRSQVCKELKVKIPCERKGCSKLFNHLSSMKRHFSRRRCASEEPIPRFKCTYANCSETYHLRSSLLRHTSQMHQNQTAPKSTASSHGKFDPSYGHSNLSGSLVVRLQSTHRREGSESGCQKKLIITPPSEPLEESQRLPLNLKSVRLCRKVEDVKPAEQPEVKPKFLHELVYRTPEEALQMCQDRCLPVAYPCMIKECVSVVSTERSLYRHYVQCHKITRTAVFINRPKLFYTAEKLEELIHRKSTISALPDSARVPSGVLKMEYQANPENSEVSRLHIKKDPVHRDKPLMRDSPPECNVLIGADDVLYGESNGHPEEVVDKHTTEKMQQAKNDFSSPPPVPPLDLSPPSNLRIRCSGAPVEPPSKESKPVAPATIYIHANPTQTRQPLKWKNSVLSEPPPNAPHSPGTDGVPPGLGSQVFDLGAYRPLGFESSFLKFIQDKDETVSGYSNVRRVVVLNPVRRPDPPRRRSSYRRKYSVKENKLRAVARSRLPRMSPRKSLLSTVERGSIKNLRFILERALMGCGDQAIKQLQFLKPVVVLERPRSSASAVQTGS